MNLNKEEITRLSYLLGKFKHLSINTIERDEIKNILTKEYKQSPDSIDGLINLGLICVGMYNVLTEYNKLNKEQSINEYIVIDEEGSVLKYNLNEEELQNMADAGYNILRVNNGKIEYADVSWIFQCVNNISRSMAKITWKEPELTEV